MLQHDDSDDEEDMRDLRCNEAEYEVPKPL